MLLRSLWGKLSASVLGAGWGGRLPAWLGRRWTAVRQRVGPLALRRKLLAAFLALVVMAGLCGAAGLVFFGRIAGSVSVLSEVTSPLLIESMALIGNLDRLRFTFLDDAVQEQDQLSALAKLDAKGRDHLGRLNVLSVRAGLGSQFEPVEQLQRDLVSSLQTLVYIRARKKSAEGAVRSGFERIAAKALLAEGKILAISRQLEIRITEDEETAKTQLQAGSATIDSLGALLARSMVGSFPALQNAHRLMGATARMRELAESAQASGSALDLQHLEAEVGRLFKTMSSIRGKLASRLRSPQEAHELAGVDAHVDELQAAFLGPEGLIAKKRELLNAVAQLTANQKQVGEIEALYAQVLVGVADAVRDRNDASRRQTAETITQGRAAIAFVVVLTGLMALLSAGFLTRSITGPLGRLTGHVRGIRERGNLVEICDRALVQASDELGELSRSFNDMIAELSQARRQMIARSEAEISKQVERLQTALTNMSQGLCMFDRDQRLIVSNDKYAETYGIAPERVYPGMTLREILEQRIAAGSYYGEVDSHADQRIAANAEAKSSDTVVELNNGRAIHIVRRPMRGGGWVATHEDVTDRRRIEAKIAHMARHDALTGLPNRVLFRETMEAALARAGRGQRIAVHCLDLDYFKSVNDTLGHPIGDALLRTVTERLLGCVREHDTIARLGGDEFAIIQLAESQADAVALARRIIETIGQPYELDAHRVVIGVSIGIAVAPDDGREPDELLKHADLALYRAKADGRGRFSFFEPEMDALMRARRRLELDLRKALADGEFELFYQPLINLETNDIRVFEALVRWRHPERGLITPGEFIPVLEEIGLIAQAGEWILKQACRQAMAWPSSVKVAVNLSPLQFNSPNLVGTVASALADAGLAASRLELEITESVLLHDDEGTMETLHQLKDLGVKIVMDDFGTGYSSLSYLRSFPFDKIKIDRSFVHDLPEREDSLAIVRAVTSLGESLHMTTTAEGVETTDQLARLRAEGCNEVQGYLFSPPVPASETARLLLEVGHSAALQVAASRGVRPLGLCGDGGEAPCTESDQISRDPTALTETDAHLERARARTNSRPSSR